MNLIKKFINIFYEEVDDNMNDDILTNSNKRLDIFYIILFIFITVLLISNFIKVDYYIYSGGGLTDTSEFIMINDNKVDSNKYFTSHVSSKDNSLFIYLCSYIFGWERVKFDHFIDDDNYNISTINLLSKNSMNTGDMLSIYLALKYNNMDVNIINESKNVFFINSKADTDVKLNDKIIFIDDKTYINDNKILFKVNRDGNIIDCYLIEGEDISLLAYWDFELDNYYGIKFSKESNVYGGSGGLINVLSIYDSLSEEDLSKGRKISGSGSIDMDGNIETIDCVKYKLKAAVDAKIDIFFVNSENYKECLELRDKYNYDINLVEVNNVKDAIDYLESR